jgi:hypothetical protein
MKKFTSFLLVTLLALTFIPVQVKAGSEKAPSPGTTAKTTESPEAKVLMTRLNEIKALDKSNLTSLEKKELRKEVLAAKKQLKELSGGVYISIGAIIIIILLLILLV